MRRTQFGDLVLLDERNYMRIEKRTMYSLLLAAMPLIKLSLQLWGITIPHFDDLLITIAGSAGVTGLATSEPIKK